MRLDNRGFVIEGAALVIIGILALFVLPQNPISGALGIGVRPNKTVETEKIEFIKKDFGGRVVAEPDGSYLVRRSYSNEEMQQHVTFLEWVRANIILVVIAFLFLLSSGLLGKAWQSRSIWKSAFKNQFNGLANLKDTTVICRKCGDTVTIDTKEHVFDNIEKKLDNRDKVLQEKVRTELVK